jgi:tetratricopeptide (TPR) repeat protein
VISNPLPGDERSKDPLVKRITRLNEQSEELYKKGNYRQAADVLKELIAIEPGNGLYDYNLACMQSLMGRKDDAMKSLQAAISKDYADIRHMEVDSDLDALHKMPAWSLVLQRRDEIQRQHAQKVAAALRKQLGDGYTYQIDDAHRLVFALCNMDQQTLDQIKSYLGSYTEAMSKDIFTHCPEQYVAVVVPRDGMIATPSVGGYYIATQHVLVARTIGSVLTHEFTHALHAADMEAMGQQHPIWIVEGLATTYENSRLRKDDPSLPGAANVVPTPNERLNVLQSLIKSGKAMPLEKFLKVQQKEYVQKANVCYPQGRYILMYLFDKGLLKKWYDLYVAGYDKDPTGQAALEKVLGKPLSEIEKDWSAWVLAQSPTPLRVTASHAYLGVSVKPVADGLRIDGVVTGSGADRAGIEPGDVLTTIDSQFIADGAELVRTVSRKNVGDTVAVEFRRGSEHKKIEVALSAMPQQPSAPKRTPASAPSTTSAPAK